MMTKIYPEKIKKPKEEFDKKMQDYYKKNIDKFKKSDDEVSFRIIFFKTVGIDPNEIEKKLELASKLKKKIEKSPDKFIEIAKENSEAEESIRGEVMGPYNINKIDSDLAAVIKELDEGEISEVFETKKGIFIVYLEKKSLAQIKSFEEAKNYIFAQCGGFYTYKYVKDYQKIFLNDLKPEFFLKNVCPATATLEYDKVVAKLGDTLLTNKDVLHKSDFLYDAVSNDPNEATQELFSIIKMKTLYESALKQGYFDSPRFENYMKAFFESSYGNHLVRLANSGEQPAELKKYGVKEVLMENIWSEYDVKIVDYPSFEWKD
jgi:hypothetical protein